MNATIKVIMEMIID